MRSLLALLLCLFALSPAPAQFVPFGPPIIIGPPIVNPMPVEQDLGGQAGYSWSYRKGSGDVTLRKDGVHVGSIRLSDGKFFPLYYNQMGSSYWGKPGLPPIPPPDVPNAPGSWRTHGVIRPQEDPESRTTIGGDTSQLERHRRRPHPRPKEEQPKAGPRKIESGPCEMQGDDDNAASKVPEFHTVPSVTVVSADKALREGIVRDLQAAPALEPFRHYRYKAMDPSAPTMRCFKLNEDENFQASGLAILIQPPEDRDGRAPPHTFYAWDGADVIGRALRDVDPNYHPNQPDSAIVAEWGLTHVVALGALALVILVAIGGALWLR